MKTEEKRMKQRCCLIGYGYWGKIVHRYLNDSADFELVGISDRHYPDAVDLDKLLKEHAIDCAVVCTPVRTHYEVVKKLLQNGVDVFCEKPLCKDYEGAKELIALAGENGATLYVDYIYTVSRSIRYIKEHLADFGKIRHISMKISQFGNFYADADVFEVIGVHMLSVLAYIFGTEHNAFFVKSIDIVKADSNGACQAASLRFEIGGVPGILECSLCSPLKVRQFEITCERGVAVFNMLAENSVQICKLGEKGDFWEIVEEDKKSFDEENNLVHVLEDFSKCASGQAEDGLLARNHEVALFIADALAKIKDCCYK